MCTGGGAQREAMEANAAGNAALVADASASLYGGMDWAQYLDANADVQQGYEKLTSAEKARFPTPEAYAQYHYQTYGQAEGRAAPGTKPGAIADARAGSADLISQMRADFEKRFTEQEQRFETLLTDTQGEHANYIGAMQSAFGNLVTGLQGQGAGITDAISKMLTGAQEQQAAMLAAINKGPTLTQKAKTPNVYDMLLKNREAARKGLGATQITGPGGVPTGSLTLGPGATLLGS